MGAGVLHARTAAARFTLNRYPPSPGLAAFVDYYWTVRWDLRGQSPHEQAILPHPTVNLAFEAQGAAVHGVDRKIFTRRIAEEGWAPLSCAPALPATANQHASVTAASRSTATHPLGAITANDILT